MNDITTYMPEQLYQLPLLEYYQRLNIPLIERGGWLLPSRFHSLADELDLFERGDAIVDFSDHGLLRIEGRDAVDFLNRISTNDFRSVSPGEAVQTVLVTEKGRIVDSVVVVHRDDHLLLIVSSGEQANVKQWIERFIIAEDLRIADRTGKYLLFAAFHPGNVLECPVEESKGFIFRVRYFDDDVVFYLFDATSVSSETMRPLLDNQVGNDALENYRIEHGIPRCKNEIMREYNPLELNLWNQISFTKGCYIGQEVIARLDTYKKIQRILCRFRTDGRLLSGTEYRLVLAEKEIGTVLNFNHDAGDKKSFAGLAVIRKEFAILGARYSLTDNSSSIVIEHIFERSE